jgi:K(+)-stimulated pyrophosphate-energized sodium pump
MSAAYILVIACGVIALLYGLVTSRQVLAADAGTARMQEISAAVQVGASAYLNRQYRTIARSRWSAWSSSSSSPQRSAGGSGSAI